MKTCTIEQRWMTLAYDDVGSGPAIVFLHAFPLDREMWQPQLAGLSDTARVLAVDLPEFGNSTPGHERFTIDHTADSLADFLTVAEIQGKVVLCGLSMGGYVALAFARRHPHQLTGLILADTKAEPDDEAARQGRDDMIAFTHANSTAAVVEKMLPRLLGDSTREDQQSVVETVRRIGSRQSVSAIVAALAALRDRPDATVGLAEIRVPTLVLVGEEDIVTPPTVAQAMVERIPSGKQVMIPGAGHLSNLENPEAFNRAVLEFLKSIR